MADESFDETSDEDDFLNIGSEIPVCKYSKSESAGLGRKMSSGQRTLSGVKLRDSQNVSMCMESVDTQRKSQVNLLEGKY